MRQYRLKIGCVSSFVYEIVFQLSAAVCNGLHCHCIRWSGSLQLRCLPHHRGAGVRMHRSTDCLRGQLSWGKSELFMFGSIHGLDVKSTTGTELL